MIQATVPSALGPLLASWRFSTPLLISAIATVYLFGLLRYGRFTAKNLSLMAVPNPAFAGCLILVLA